MGGERTPWQDFDQWREYGLKNELYKKSSNEVATSRNKEEKRWHKRGDYKEWLDNFSFSKKNSLGKNRHILRIERIIGKPLKDFLTGEYIIKRKTVCEIAEGLKTSNTAVYRWLDVFEIQRNKRKKVSREEIEKLYSEAGLSINKTAQTLGVTNTYLNKLIKSHGLLRGNKLSKDKLEELYIKNNLSISEIAKVCNISNFKIYGLLEKYNIPVRKQVTLHSIYGSFEQWKDFGLTNGFNKRNPLDIYKSEDKNEKAWYNFGIKKRDDKGLTWVSKFDFTRLSNRHDYLKNNYISSNEQFSKLLENPLAKNLAALALAPGSVGFDIEGLMIEVLPGKFRNRKELHDYLESNKKDKKNISDLVENGITSLGPYVGEFSLNERKILPILLGEVISSLPESVINSSLENRLGRMLTAYYSPEFNKDSNEAISKIEKILYESKGKAKEIYQVLYNHYQEVLKIREELK